MEKLAPELYAEILECILRAHPRTNASPKARLAPYAAISRRWKDCVERYTFEEFDLRTTELDTFAQLFSGAHIRRREALKSLKISFILPDPPNVDGCCDVEAVPDRKADSEAFTDALHHLFAIISDLEQRSQGDFPLSLVLHQAYRSSPSKYRFGGVYKNRCRQHTRIHVQAARADSGQFELLSGTYLPILTQVTALKFIGYRLLADLKPTWISTIKACLPKLERLLVQERDLYTLGRVRRIKHRHELQRAFCLLPVDHLTEIVLDIDHTPLQNENVPVQKLVGQGIWREETWSVVIRHLAQFRQLRKLHLLGELVVCSEFFQTITEYEGTPFISLQEFVLEFAIETADGRWFYQRDEEAFERAENEPELKAFLEYIADSEESEDGIDDVELDSDTNVRLFEDSPVRTSVVRRDRFRTLPDKDTFRLFLLNASRAVSRLPQLRKFILTLADRNTSEGNGLDYPFISRMFELWWLRSGEPRSPSRAKPEILCYPKVLCDSAYIYQNRLYWRTGDWIPWEEVQEAWTEAAGPSAKIVFLKEEHWHWRPGRGQRTIYYGEF